MLRVAARRPKGRGGLRARRLGSLVSVFRYLRAKAVHSTTDTWLRGLRDFELAPEREAVQYDIRYSVSNSMKSNYHTWTYEDRLSVLDMLSQTLSDSLSVTDRLSDSV